MRLNAINLFSGVGGLTHGMVKAGFKVTAAIELNEDAAKAYKLNFPKVRLIEKDVRKVKISEVKKILGKRELHLVAGCPPCQGFSSVRRRNKKNVKDKRNILIFEFLRFVKGLKPITILMENVPGLMNYYQFDTFLNTLIKLGYKDAANYKVVNMKDYGIPQRRRRLTIIASRMGNIALVEGNKKIVTVRDAIGKLKPPNETKDKFHKIFNKHSKKIKDMIRKIPHNGGSRKDLPKKYILECHKADNIGFYDIYGRMRWDQVSNTITGGCLNPSKGRFLHPSENRCITPREASILQSFPKDYKFPININKDSLALLIGNALPPKFSYIQCKNIRNHLKAYLD